jgi:hypothetical protein
VARWLAQFVKQVLFCAYRVFGAFSAAAGAALQPIVARAATIKNILGIIPPVNDLNFVLQDGCVMR